MTDDPRRYPSSAPDAARMAQAVEQLVRLCAADSTSGREAAAVDVAALIAGELGLPVERLPAAPQRDNLLVGASDPDVVLCTHLDTVPPFIAPRVDGNIVWGRGTCDAKGVAIAMLHGLATARDLGVSIARAAVLLVVGEETDHVGAQAAVELARSGRRFAPRHIVLGEPCGMRPAVGQKGLLKLRLAARGTAGHSAYPELGASAIHHLVDALARLRQAELPSDPLLGATTLNIGQLSGGLAPNVIAPSAEATIVIRCAAPAAAVLEATRALVGADIAVTELGRAEPIDFETLGEEAGPAVPFNTDAHHLAPLGARLSLMGPGDMRCAHGANEHLAVADLAEGIARFAETLIRSA
ncbi:MAG: M20/M25/M40 family metallo-hydrolase [Myxococcota bacterium]